MTKLTKEIYESHAKRLEVILNDQSSFSQFLARQDFAKLIENELDILAVLETKFPKDLLEEKYLAKTLVAKYNTKTNKKYELNLKHPYEDDSDLIDAVNYLVTYCKNIFKVELDDAVAGKKVVASAPNINFNETRNQGGENASGFAGMFAGMDGMSQAAGFNPFAFSKATTQVQNEVATGKLYRFNKKPKQIPGIKIATIVLMLLAFIGILGAAICFFVINKFNINSDSDPRSLVTNGVLYLVVAAFIGYDASVLIKSLCKTKQGNVNDNDKYYYAWPFVLIAIVMVAFVLGFDGSAAVGSVDFVADTPDYKLNAFQAFKVLWWVGMGSTIALLIPLIMGAVFNPKPNDKIIEDRIQELMSQMGVGMQQPAAGVDVQKPVDVKPSTENKKEEVKPSSDKESKTQEPKK